MLNAFHQYALLGIALTLFSVPARANEYTVSASMRGPGLEVLYSFIWRETLSNEWLLEVPKFDPSRGTLEAVTLDYAIDAEVSGRSIYPDAYGVLTTMDSGALIYDFGIHVAPLLFVDSGGFTFRAAGHLQDDMPRTRYDFYSKAFSATGREVYADPASLTTILTDTYPTFAVDLLAAASRLEITPLPFASMYNDSVASVTFVSRVDVTYRYQPVPEPTSLAGLGGALVVFRMNPRRRGRPPRSLRDR